jgi:hypothetical protein
MRARDKRSAVMLSGSSTPPHPLGPQLGAGGNVGVGRVQRGVRRGIGAVFLSARNRALAAETHNVHRADSPPLAIELTRLQFLPIFAPTSKSPDRAVSTATDDPTSKLGEP